MKKIMTILFAGLICLSLTGCGSENKTTIDNKDNDTNISEDTNSLTSIDDFEKEVKNLGITYTKTDMVATYINAESGIKLVNGDYKLEIYKFDSSTDAYKNAEKNQKVTMEGFGDFDAIVKNGYALMIDDEFPKYDSVIEIFNKLK